MDMTPFYELRYRLICTAAAGCAGIGEDFRLHRAVANFQPLSAANKAFSRLSAMCDKLLHTPDSLLLADCIALANALAVAQGKSQDDSPVEEGAAEAPGTHPVDIPNSLLSTLTMLNSNSVKMLRDPSHQYLGDPRILAAYLRNADDTSKEWSSVKDELAEQMALYYGTSLVPLLKDACRKCGPRTAGKLVLMVWKLAGASENPWYLAMAQDENNPRNIRLQALDALRNAPEYGQELLELYRTERGSVREAALTALVRNHVPEAEPYLRKLAQSNDGKFCAPIAASEDAAYLDVVMEKAEPVLSMIRENRAEHASDQERLDGCIRMLANKPDAAPAFLRIADAMSKHARHYLFFELMMNRVLMNNVCDHEKFQPYGAVIEQLYAQNAQFLPAYLYWQIWKTDWTHPAELMTLFRAHQPEALDILRNGLRYCPSQKVYGMYWMNERLSRLPLAHPLFSSMPEELVQFLTDTSYLPAHETLPAELGMRHWDVLTTQEREAEQARYELAEKQAFALQHLLQIVAPEDRSMLQEQTRRFLQKVLQRYSGGGLWDLAEYYGVPLPPNAVLRCALFYVFVDQPVSGYRRIEWQIGQYRIRGERQEELLELTKQMALICAADLPPVYQNRAKKILQIGALLHR